MSTILEAKQNQGPIN